jgi:hypothetical protein
MRKQVNWVLDAAVLGRNYVAAEQIDRDVKPVYRIVTGRVPAENVVTV